MEPPHMNHLEVIADAITHQEGWRPGSVSNRNRNPGNLRKGEGQIGTDPAGYAIFECLHHGQFALSHDLTFKFLGQTTTGLTPQSTFADLIKVYAPAEDHNDPASYFAAVKDWFQRATGKTITADTRLEQIWTPTSPQGSL